MYDLITNSDTNSLGTLNAPFLALLHALLTIYSSGYENGWKKTNNLMQWFGLLHNDKQIRQTYVLLVLTSYFCLKFIFRFDVAQFDVLFCFLSEKNIRWK